MIENNGCPVAVAVPVANTFTDPRDQQIYRTVNIGKQTWFAQNLNYQTSDSWCYLQLPEFCEKAGQLYTWEAAKTACPKGWHLPTEEDWKILSNNFGEEAADAYRYLIQGGNNNFAALLGGLRSRSGEFYGLSKYGYYWSATGKDADSALFFGIGNVVGGVGQFLYDDKEQSFSCRCLKD